jgi:polysaccharide deacetylase 2 family uncharacterized protein YibQ
MAALFDDAHSAGAPRAVRALAVTGAFLVCIVMAGAATVTLLGNGRGGASVTLDLRPGDLAPGAAPRAAPAIPRANMVAPDIKRPPVTTAQYAGHVLVADPALIENTPLGPLPRIADDGRKPMNVYAAPAAPGKLRIAIMVSGLGLSAKATQNALAALPAAVTLGVLPYASDAAHWAGEARARGHEVLLEIPMEPFDFPDSDPGPHTLRAGADADSNAARLDWALSRFTGYAGVTNLLGARLLADADALSPILTALTRRGLYFYDSGVTAQSVAPVVAGRVGTAFARGDTSLDTIQTALEIDRRLSDLEAAARAHGSAVGSAFLYPVSVERIALWAKTLQSRGFVLVPVSAIVAAQKQ